MASPISSWLSRKGLSSSISQIVEKEETVYLPFASIVGKTELTLMFLNY